MSIPNAKFTMFFIDQFGVGWQESHYYGPLPTPAPALATYQAKAMELATQRVANLLGNLYTLTTVRVSYDNVFRDSILFGPSTPGFPQKNEASTPPGLYPGNSKTNNLSAAAQQAASTQIAIPFLMSMANNTKRAITYNGGLSNNQVQVCPPINNTSATIGGWLQGLQAWGSYLAGIGQSPAVPSQWGAPTYVPVPAVPGPGSATVPCTAITQVTLVGTGQFALVLTVGAPFITTYGVVKGNKISLNGATMSWPVKRIRLNGTYTVYKADPVAGTITCVAEKFFQQPTIGLTGTVTLLQQVFNPYQAYTIRAVTHRKRGKPSFEPRGRR